MKKKTPTITASRQELYMLGKELLRLAKTPMFRNPKLFSGDSLHLKFGEEYLHIEIVPRRIYSNNFF